MKQLKAINQLQYFFKLIFIVTIIALSIINVSCSDTKETTSTNNYPAYDFAAAVEKISSLATKLTIKSYQTGSQTVIHKDSPDFPTIINYIKQSTPTKSQPRFVEDETGKTAMVTIPYSLNYFLNFTLNDGSEVVFDYGGDIWFNSKDMIYGASPDDAMFELIQQLAGK